GVQESVGELVVGLDDRVDVGRVQKRDAPRHALDRGQHEQAVAARPGQAFLADPGQGGQEVVLSEPVDVVGVTGQDGTVRGGAADAGRAHVCAHDAVDQSGLARSGGANQGDQDGRGGLPDSGQQVVVDVAEQL